MRKKTCYVDKEGRALQPIAFAKDKVVRFKGNAIVQLLLDDGKYYMNRLALMPFSESDRVQFLQLIGYSVSGFGELSYVPKHYVEAADKIANKLC